MWRWSPQRSLEPNSFIARESRSTAIRHRIEATKGIDRGPWGRREKNRVRTGRNPRTNEWDPRSVRRDSEFLTRTKISVADMSSMDVSQASLAGPHVIWAIYRPAESNGDLYTDNVHTHFPILVAEDSDDDFFFFRRAIRAARIENPVLRFRDGSELTRFLEKVPTTEFTEPGQPWLLFVDITMPIMNGFEVLDWIRHRDEAAKFSTIVLSGSYRDEDIKRALSLGAKDYLVKPISPAMLAVIAADCGLVPA